MKKKTTLLLCSLFLLIWGCQKDNSKSKNSALLTKPSSTLKADSLTDSIKTRPITINDVTCVNANTVVPLRLTSTYVVIGRFPANNNTVPYFNALPKQSWTINGYTLSNQANGDLVLYSPTGVYLWGTGNTVNKTTQFRLQNDLNMVAYSGTTPVWDSKTQSYRCTNHTYPERLPRNMMLVLVNDGDLEIVADGRDGSGHEYTVILGGTRTYGGQVSPNLHTFFNDYSSAPGTSGVSFIW